MKKQDILKVLYASRIVLSFKSLYCHSAPLESVDVILFFCVALHLFEHLDATLGKTSPVHCPKSISRVSTKSEYIAARNIAVLRLSLNINLRKSLKFIGA
jgi:hypothetical protein